MRIPAKRSIRAIRVFKVRIGIRTTWTPHPHIFCNLPQKTTMPHKEHYRHNLPHFQQPWQAYFVTWNLKDAVPKKAMERYKKELELVKLKIKSSGATYPGLADSRDAIHSGDPRLNKTADRNPPYPESMLHNTFFLPQSLIPGLNTNICLAAL
jgi:hypothetical protein